MKWINHLKRAQEETLIDLAVLGFFFLLGCVIPATICVLTRTELPE